MDHRDPSFALPIIAGVAARVGLHVNGLLAVVTIFRCDSIAENLPNSVVEVHTPRSRVGSFDHLRSSDHVFLPPNQALEATTTQIVKVFHTHLVPITQSALATDHHTIEHRH
jgi:hypothetical protein